jgi:DNA methylase/ParB-like nuclease domain
VTADASPTRRVPAPAREVPLSDLRPHPSNPRRITDARLAQLGRTLEAEREMLQARPLIALPDGTVIAGNQRLAAAVALGWESIPVVYADLDAATARRWMLLDNRPAGEDDVEALAVMLRELDAGQQDLAGYAAEDVDAILRAAQPARTADPDIVPAPPRTPTSSLGAIYELGSHRLMCGDATDSEALAELLNGVRPELGIADPPYNVDEDYETYDDDRNDADYLAFTEAWFAHLTASTQRQVVTPGWNNLPLWCRLYRFRAIGAWTKSNAMTRGSVSRFNCWEPVLFFGDGWQRVRSSDVFDVPVRVQPGGAGSPIKGVAHPCPKPVELWTDLVEVGSERDESIFDPFAGAGTALITAEVTGRRCFAMEIDPGYCDVIRQRYADYTGQPELAP